MTYHNASFHLVASVAHVLDAKVAETFVEESTLLFPHFTLRVDDTCRGDDEVLVHVVGTSIHQQTRH